MKVIALTGHPLAQEAAHLQLAALLTQRGMDGEVLVIAGTRHRLEAHAAHDSGGEVWQCGAGEPDPLLVSSIDRTLPATTFEAMGPHVVTCLAEFVAKTRIGA